MIPIVASFANSHTIVELRSYPYLSIPDGVPWYRYDPNPVPPLPDTGSVGHWIFDHVGSPQNNVASATSMSNQLTGTCPASLETARDERRTCIRATQNLNLAVSGTSNGLDPTIGFAWEIWVKGVDSTFAGNLSFGFTGSARSWSVSIDASSRLVTFKLSSGASSVTVTGSIAQHIVSENPEYWHRWAGSWVSGLGLYLYEDGAELGFGLSTMQINTGANTGTFAVTGGKGLVIDELNIANSYMLPDDNLARYQYSQPHVFRKGQPSTSILPHHQARFTLFGTTPGAVRVYQFSMRGISDLNLYSADAPLTTPMMRFPVFTNTGSI